MSVHFPPNLRDASNAKVNLFWWPVESAAGMQGVPVFGNARELTLTSAVPSVTAEHASHEKASTVVIAVMHGHA